MDGQNMYKIKTLYWENGEQILLEEQTFNQEGLNLMLKELKKELLFQESSKHEEYYTLLICTYTPDLKTILGSESIGKYNKASYETASFIINHLGR